MDWFWIGVGLFCRMGLLLVMRMRMRVLNWVWVWVWVELGICKGYWLMIGFMVIGEVWLGFLELGLKRVKKLRILDESMRMVFILDFLIY